MTDAEEFAFRVVECTCTMKLGSDHQSFCAKLQARELMRRNDDAPHRVEHVTWETADSWFAVKWPSVWQYEKYSTGAAAHRAYLEIVSRPKRMKGLKHVRLYIGCELKAERKWRST